MPTWIKAETAQAGASHRVLARRPGRRSLGPAGAVGGAGGGAAAAWGGSGTGAGAGSGGGVGFARLPVSIPRSVPTNGPTSTVRPASWSTGRSGAVRGRSSLLDRGSSRCVGISLTLDTRAANRGDGLAVDAGMLGEGTAAKCRGRGGDRGGVDVGPSGPRVAPREIILP